MTTAARLLKQRKELEGQEDEGSRRALPMKFLKRSDRYHLMHSCRRVGTGLINAAVAG